MRMSRERVFHLADLIMKGLGTTPGVTIKAPDDLRVEIVRVLSDETKLEESIDGEVRKILASYAPGVANLSFGVLGGKDRKTLELGQAGAAIRAAPKRRLYLAQRSVRVARGHREMRA